MWNDVRQFFFMVDRFCQLIVMCRVLGCFCHGHVYMFFIYKWYIYIEQHAPNIDNGLSEYIVDNKMELILGHQPSIISEVEFCNWNHVRDIKQD